MTIYCFVLFAIKIKDRQVYLHAEDTKLIRFKVVSF